MPTRRLSHACAALVLLLCVLAGLCDLFVQSTRLRNVQRSRGVRALRMDADHDVDLIRNSTAEGGQLDLQCAELCGGGVSPVRLAFREMVSWDRVAPPAYAETADVSARGPPSFS